MSRKIRRRELLRSSAGVFALSGCLQRKSSSGGGSGEGTDIVSSVPASYSTGNLVPENIWEGTTEDTVWASPTVVNGRVYVGSNDGSLYSFGEVGEEELEWEDDYPMYKYDLLNTNAPESHGPKGEVEEKWEFETGGIVNASPVAVEGILYFGSEDGSFYSVDAETGEERWSIDTDKCIFGSASLVEGNLYVPAGSSVTDEFKSISSDPDDSGSLYSVDPEDGEVIWEFEMGAGSHSSPAVSEEAVYFGSHDRNVYAVEIETGEEVWSFETGDIICGNAPALKDGTVYAGSDDYSLYALDAENGDVLWEFETGDKVTSSAAVDQDSIYFGSGDGKFYCLDRRTGGLRWEFGNGEDPIVSSPALKEGLLYFGSNDGKVYTVDAVSGEEVWSYDTGSMVLSSPAVAGDTAYVGSYNGKVYAVENSEQED